mgnify:CR=1 FL=1
MDALTLTCTRSCFLSNTPFMCIAIIFCLAFATPTHASTNNWKIETDKEVRGKVTGKDSPEGLPGVNIFVKGSTTGTVTDIEGNYTITVPGDESILVFSYIGFISKEVTVGARTTIDVILDEDVKNLDEVVVIGYGTQRKSDITGAVTGLNEEQFNKGSITSPDQLLQGKIPGVNVVQNSGEPGGGISINIRGAGSINASNSPLFVIDGLPIDNGRFNNTGTEGFTETNSSRNPLSSINPADIESIDVLKDASATAIYGARGANGVIIITTKKGAAGKTKVNYDGYAGIQNVSNTVDLLSPEEYMQELNAIIDAGGGDPSQRVESIDNGGTNWQEEIYADNAVVHSHNLSFSGGNEKTTFLASLNHFDQDGIIINSGFKRYGARLNLANKVSDRFNVGLNLTSTYSRDDYVAVGQEVNERAGVVYAANNYDPTQAIFNDDGTYMVSPWMQIDNPLAIANGKTSINNTFRTLGTVYGEYFVLPELSFKLNVGGDVRTDERATYVDKTTNWGRSSNGVATIREGTRTNYLFEGTANYNKDFGRQSLNILLGITSQNFISTSHTSTASGFPSDVTGANNLGLGDPNFTTSSSNKSGNQLASYLGRVNYSLQDKYLLTATMRIDGSSRFGANNKFGYFPSVAAGWKLHREDFFGPLTNAISTLKLRVSWGQTGNQEIGNYRSISTFSSGSRDRIGWDDQQYLTTEPSRLANPDLKWETTEMFNVGLDFGILEDRINGSLEYFQKNTKDMLIELPIPSSTGFDDQLRNVGSVANSGLELGLTANVLTGAFNWDLNLSLSTITNEVTDLGGIPQIITGNAAQTTSGIAIIREGDPLYSFYGWEITGIWQEDDDFSQTTDNVEPGSIKFRDVNGDGTVNGDDRVILGNSFPGLIWSVGSTFSFKNFQLYLFIDGQEDVEMFNAQLGDTYYPSNFRRNRYAEPILNRWTPSNPTNEYPSFINEFSQGTKAVNSYTVEDASYVRLSTVQLSYHVPTGSGSRISDLTLYVTGQNLFTLTNYQGMNPALNSRGNANFRVDWNAYPLATSFLFGVKLGL